MPRPTNKAMLLEQSEQNFDKLFKMVDSLPPEQQEGEFQFEDRDRNIRDVLTHLHEWHLMMLDWYKVGMSGEKPDIPKKGYTWKTLPEMNVEIWKEYQNTSLEDAKEELIKSHKKVMNLIENHSDEELFTKKFYKWTNTTSLGAYFISATSSHYDWAMKKIRKYIKTL